MSKLCQRLHLLLFLGAVGVTAAMSWAQSMPAELRALYEEADLDPASPCLRTAIPTTRAEHADRRKCMLQEYVNHGGALAAEAVHLRGYVRLAEMAEEAASEAERKFADRANRPPVR